MARTTLYALLAFALWVAPARADDPEPPDRHQAKAAGLTIKASRGGALTASDAQGKAVWTFERKGARGRPQLVGGARLLALDRDALWALDARTGKLLWELRLTDLREQKWTMSLGGDEVTISTRGRKEVIDARSGRVLKVVNSR
jgi:outer membrane protein assembly factor BamB